MIDELKNFVADGISACKILVVGDVMSDKYYFGGNVTLHPIDASRPCRNSNVIAEFKCRKNFCGRSAND
ncbi:MAG: hypothetical protein IKP64_07015 [Selenomonadaceae bacterium]|nr:hypothetical protein [Selenomonadaceae bacterium]